MFLFLPMLAARLLLIGMLIPSIPTRRDNINKFISSCWQGGAIDERPLLDTLTEVLYSLYDQDYFTSAF